MVYSGVNFRFASSQNSSDADSSSGTHYHCAKSITGVTNCLQRMSLLRIMHVQMDVPLLVAVEAFQLFYSIQASRISSELNKELNFCQLQDCKQRKEIVVRATDLIYLQLYFLVPFLVLVKIPYLTELKVVLQCTHSSKSCVGIFSTSYVFRTYKISYTENSLKSLITVTCKNCIFSSSDQHITQFFTSTHVLLVFTQATNEVIRSVKD